MTAHFVDLINDLRRRSLRMASLVEDIVEEACDAVCQPGDELALRVIARDRDVDAEEVQVESEVIRLLALYQPVGADLRLLCTVLKVNNDFERIADCAVNIAERARYLSADALNGLGDDINRMAPIVRRMLRAAVKVYGMQNTENAESVFEEEEVVDALYGQIVRDVVSEATRRPGDMPTLLDVLSIAKNLERIADHATNIAEDVVFLCTGKIVRHRMRKSQDRPQSR
ncbi:MAG: phosphate signaling complex protein PhoU [Phycisphaerae bacterium]|nr:phosphate signaling complex protein PhoU [Phycisphaerae bacterium]